MDCSICIATYKRPDLLKECLSSIAQLELRNDLQVEIVLVDNDKAQSAKSIFEWFKQAHTLPVRYCVQEKQSISHARNMAIQNAKGKLIAFIDDDETADKEWLALLIETQKEYKADAVFGNVITWFESTTPPWIQGLFIYERKIPPTGTIAESVRTTNAIVDAKWFSKKGYQFDAEYGITGGSDTKLFETMRINNAKLINCREAKTYEYCPPNRTKFKWLLKRSFRGGNNVSRIDIELNPKRKMILRCTYLIIGFTYSTISLVLAILHIFIPSKRAHWILKMAANMGKMAAIFNYYPDEYKS